MYPKALFQQALRSGGACLVSHAAYRDDDFRVLRVFLDLGAESLDVHVDQPCVGRVTVTPDLLKQHFMAQPQKLGSQKFAGLHAAFVNDLDLIVGRRAGAQAARNRTALQHTVLGNWHRILQQSA